MPLRYYFRLMPSLHRGTKRLASDGPASFIRIQPEEVKLVALINARIYIYIYIFLPGPSYIYDDAYVICWFLDTDIDNFN